MKKLKMLKAAKQSKMWKKNQRLWLFYPGDRYAKVVGRYRGKGRYVAAWYHWNDKTLPKIVECDVTDHFYNKIHDKYCSVYNVRL